MDVKCALIWGVTLFGVCPYLGCNHILGYALIWAVTLFGVCPYLGWALIWDMPACDPYMRCVLQVLSLEEGHQRTTCWRLGLLLTKVPSNSLSYTCCYKIFLCRSLQAAVLNLDGGKVRIGT